MPSLTIGRLAKRTGVGVETIRFYEREGLIAPPPRAAFGFRQYAERDVARIRSIRWAKDLGFSLKEIKELLALKVTPEHTCEEVQAKAAAKIAGIEDKIRSLQGMRAALTRLAEICPNQGPASECPILEALAGEEVPRAHR